MVEKLPPNHLIGFVQQSQHQKASNNELIHMIIKKQAYMCSNYIVSMPESKWGKNTIVLTPSVYKTPEELVEFDLFV